MTTKQIKCNICLEDIDNPVFTPCIHGFCDECISKWINEKKQFANIPCPVCKYNISDLAGPRDESKLFTDDDDEAIRMLIQRMAGRNNRRPPANTLTDIPALPIAVLRGLGIEEMVRPEMRSNIFRGIRESGRPRRGPLRRGAMLNPAARIGSNPDATPNVTIATPNVATIEPTFEPTLLRRQTNGLSNIQPLRVSDNLTSFQPPTSYLPNGILSRRLLDSMPNNIPIIRRNGNLNTNLNNLVDIINSRRQSLTPPVLPLPPIPHAPLIRSAARRNLQIQESTQSSTP